MKDLIGKVVIIRDSTGCCTEGVLEPKELGCHLTVAIHESHLPQKAKKKSARRRHTFRLTVRSSLSCSTRVTSETKNSTPCPMRWDFNRDKDKDKDKDRLIMVRP